MQAKAITNKRLSMSEKQLLQQISAKTTSKYNSILDTKSLAQRY